MWLTDSGDGGGILPPNQFHTSPTRFRDKERDKIKFKLLFVAVSLCPPK